MSTSQTPRDTATSTGLRRLLASGDPSLATHHATYGALPVPSRGPAGLTELVKLIEAAGLRGRGGGWFPTARKIEAAAGHARRRRQRPLVIANGMEGEPASQKDAVLLLRSPHLVLDGLAVVAQALNARESILAVAASSPALPTLRAAIAHRRAANLDRRPPRLLIGPERYVASEESALANAAGGGPPLPTFTPRRHETGLGRRPTLVSNVETLAQLACIVRYGSDWFRQVGTSTAPGTTLVTVSGIATTSGVVEIAVGTTISSILASVGGATEPLQACLVGGFGGTWIPARATTAGWSPEQLTAVGGVVGAGVLGTIGPGTCGLAETSRIMWWMAGQSAGQCGPCRFGLAAVATSFAQLSDRTDPVAAYEQLRLQLGLIPGRGACRHPDGATRLASSALQVFAEELALHLGGGCTAPNSRAVLSVPPPGNVPARQPKRSR